MDIQVKRIEVDHDEKPKYVKIYTLDGTVHEYKVIGYGTYNVVIAQNDIVLKLSREPSTHITDDVMCDYVYGNLMYTNANGYPVNPFIYQSLITLGTRITLASDLHTMTLYKYIISNTARTRAANMKIVIETLAHALYLLKNSRILHRDIKPGNILVDTDNTTITKVYLIDFGISTTTYRSEPLHESVTEWYRAPEITTVKKYPNSYSYSSDTWSVGVVLYEYLHGSPMFQSTGNENLIKLHSETFPDIPASPYKHIIEQMIVIEPYKRITPDQLLIALDLPILPVYPVGYDSIVKVRTKYSVEYKPLFNAAALLDINLKSKLFNYALSIYLKLVAREGHSYLNAVNCLLIGLKLVSYDYGLYVEYTSNLLKLLNLDASIEQLIENELRIVQLFSPLIDLSVVSIGTASLSS